MEERKIGNLTVKPTKLKDCYEIIPRRFDDSRGFFSSVTDKELRALGFKEFTQKSESCSTKGVFRGLHYQLNPYCQTKVVSCARGRVLDVVVDVRKDSPTFGDYIEIELSAEKGNALYVPRGFAHGYMCLENNSLFQYQVDNEYKPKYEDGIVYSDSFINIDWDAIKAKYSIDEITLSDKDTNRHDINGMLGTFTRKPKKFLITGVKGQLGYDLVRELKARGENDILAIDIDDMDITNRTRVFELVDAYRPDVIFHCAAMTSVDKAEDMEEVVRKINVEGTKNLVDASIEYGSKIVYMSTDYVFDGKKDGLYTEEDKTNPKSVYGETKFKGEEEVRRNPNHFITRISWVFGINGHNFINTIIKNAYAGRELNVVDDQVGSPTYTVDLAKLLVEMSYTNKYGTYNVNNDGYCSWYEFAKYILETTGIETTLNPVTTEEYLRITSAKQAYRPRNSKLDKTKLVEAGFDKLPTWQDATDRYVGELKETNKMLLLKHPNK